MPISRARTGRREFHYATVERAARNSLCFGLYEKAGGSQVGLTRVVTDHAIFAYLCDVYVLEEHRGRGLGKFLMKTVMAHPALTGARRAMLGTRDAHGLYRQFGFTDATGTTDPHGNRTTRPISNAGIGLTHRTVYCGA